jgi:hypothetical protein
MLEHRQAARQGDRMSCAIHLEAKRTRSGLDGTVQVHRNPFAALQAFDQFDVAHRRTGRIIVTVTGGK